MGQGPYYLGIDVGGTNIKIGVVDDLGSTMSHSSTPTEAKRGAEAGVETIGNLARQVVTDSGLSLSDISGVGVATPGTMDIQTGMLLEPPNLGWFNFPIRDRVAENLCLPAVLQNDANAAAYGEFWAGAARDVPSLVFWTLGTGIGTALFIDGRLLPNTELGHLEVHGIEAEHRASAKVRVDRRLGWVDWAAEVNAVLASYHALLWPDLFIIGGGVTENWQYFAPLLTSRAEIVRARFGNDAGIIGAAMAASAGNP